MSGPTLGAALIHVRCAHDSSEYAGLLQKDIAPYLKEGSSSAEERLAQQHAVADLLRCFVYSGDSTGEAPACWGADARAALGNRLATELHVEAGALLMSLLHTFSLHTLHTLQFHRLPRHVFWCTLCFLAMLTTACRPGLV